MTKTRSTFAIVAVTLLVLASVPMFNQPTAVAQSEGGATGACDAVRFGCLVLLTGDTCIDLSGQWYGEGSECGMAGPCDSLGFCPPRSVACCLGDGGCFAVVPDLCVDMGGTPSPPGTRCSEVTCDQPCYGDVDGDGAVGINDFLDLLAAWGDCK